MAINIKSEEAVRLARLVASRTGESLTRTIQVALQERLERLEQAVDEPDRRARIDELVATFRRTLGPYSGAGLTAADLYGDDGLPA